MAGQRLRQGADFVAAHGFRADRRTRRAIGAQRTRHLDHREHEPAIFPDQDLPDDENRQQCDQQLVLSVVRQQIGLAAVDRLDRADSRLGGLCAHRAALRQLGGGRNRGLHVGRDRRHFPGLDDFGRRIEKQQKADHRTPEGHAFGNTGVERAGKHLTSRPRKLDA